MAEKFLYYLGAGASAGALPTVKPIHNADGTVKNEGFVNTLRTVADKFRRRSFPSDEQKNYLITLADKLDHLAKESSDFATVDTYAKFLYLRDQKQYQELATTLSAFFTLYQLWFDKFDKRYLSWLTSVMQDAMFPDNIKILSWNYDYQMQLAATYFQIEQFTYNQGGYHKPPLIRYWPAVGWSGHPGHTSRDISLLHLNGLAGAYFNKETNRYHNLFIEKDQLLENSNLHLLREYGHSCIFNFAWEKKGGYKDWVIDLAQEMIAETSIVVVIGYSFPFFNRDIDKKVFEKLKQGPLSKIYFQDPNLDGSFLRAQFNLPEHVEIVHRKEVDSFYIPFEL